MKGIRVACLQLQAPTGDVVIGDRVAGVLAQLDGLAPVDLVVLPELWSSGYFCFEDYPAIAQDREGPLVQAVAAAARRLEAHVVGGSFVERTAGGGLRNTSFVVDPAGEVVGWYSKVHVFGYRSREAELVEAGDETATIETDLGRIGLALCYDLRFPELFRRLVDDGAELIVVPAAWPALRVADWQLLTRARALENQAFVIACNGAGLDVGTELGGHSVIVDPRGVVVAEAGREPATLRADIDPGVVQEWRRTFPVLQDRRLGERRRSHA